MPWFWLARQRNRQSLRQRCCPGGTCDNSPTFQRWVRARGGFSPEGTADPAAEFSRPFGTNPAPGLLPTLKRWAIFMMSLRDEAPVNFRKAAGSWPQFRRDAAERRQWNLIASRLRTDRLRLPSRWMHGHFPGNIPATSLIAPKVFSKGIRQSLSVQCISLGASQTLIKRNIDSVKIA